MLVSNKGALLKGFTVGIYVEYLWSHSSHSNIFSGNERKAFE